VATLALKLDVPPACLVAVIVMQRGATTRPLSITHRVLHLLEDEAAAADAWPPPDHVERDPMMVQRWTDECGRGVVIDGDGLRVEVRADEVCT
jgi:hypothetical protein